VAGTIHGEVAPTIAEAINAVYCKKGVERRVEVRQREDGTLYIRLTDVELWLLGIE